jgi:hypothetical protein
MNEGSIYEKLPFCYLFASFSVETPVGSPNLRRPESSADPAAASAYGDFRKFEGIPMSSTAAYALRKCHAFGRVNVWMP